MHIFHSVFCTCFIENASSEAFCSYVYTYMLFDSYTFIPTTDRCTSVLILSAVCDEFFFRCTDYLSCGCDKNVRKWSSKDDGFFLRFRPHDDEQRIIYLYVCRQTQLNITASTLSRTIILSYAMASLHNQHDINRLRPRQNDRHFADDIFKYISF